LITVFVVRKHLFVDFVRGCVERNVGVGINTLYSFKYVFAENMLCLRILLLLQRRF
jgi:hypothetical protein